MEKTSKSFGTDHIPAADIVLAAVRGGLGGTLAQSIGVGVEVRRVGVGFLPSDVGLAVLLASGSTGSVGCA